MSADNASSLGFTNPSDLVNCTVDTCSIYTSFYNYRIDLVPNVVFLALFGLAILFFYAVFFYTRRGFWFMVAMQLGLTSEVLGYVGRILSYNNQWDLNGFLLNNICLTLGPAFFSAAIYLCLGRIVVVYGPQNSRIRPDLFTKVFVPCDLVAIILQGTGGSIAGAALGTDSSLSVGDDVITAGLSSQVGTLFLFMCLAADFVLTVHRRRKQLGDEVALPQEPQLVAIRGSKMFYFFPYALGLSTILIFWRCCYRVAELNQGFTGSVTYNQPLFVGFEGVLMVLTVVALAIFHPAFCIGEVMNSGKSLGFGDGNGIGLTGLDEPKETQRS